MQLRFRIWWMLLCILAGQSAVSGQNYMFNRGDFAVGAGPNGVAVGDFNHDGMPDLVVVNGSFGSISVLLGKPDGTFQSHVDYTTEANPIQVVVADVNHDGKQDILVTSLTSSIVSIFLGKGNGTFNTPLSVDVGVSDPFIAVADFNHDGKLDLAVISQNGPSSVAIFLGNGNGTFKPAVNYPTAFGPNSIVAADFNSDGRLDLAVATSSGISVLLGKGDGSFGPYKNFPAGGAPIEIIAGDFNGDGRLDLAVANDGQFSLSVLLGDGTGSFGAPITTPTSPSPGPLVAFDFNHDGKLDLAVVDGNGVITLSIFFGNGDGSFQPPVHYAAAGIASGLALGDFNHDGIIDLAVTDFQNNPSNVSIFLGVGDGTFAALRTAATPDFAAAVAVADFNGDGHKDLAIVNAYSNTVSIYLGHGDGTFGAGAAYPVGNQANEVGSIAVGDFNGDGKPDLAVLNFADSTVSILLNNGDGTFRGPFNSPTASAPWGLTVADFNHDGKLDIAVGGGSVSVLLGKGDGTFQNHVEYAINGGSGPVVAADFNNDGNIDIAATNTVASTVSVLLGKGDGTFSPHKDFAAGLSPQSIIAVDLNHDGKPDLVIGGVFVLLGKGDGTFQSEVNYPAGTSGNLFAVDLNGDGNPDVLANVVLLRGNGDGTLQQGMYLNYAPGTAAGIAAADFDEDGSPDLVLTGGTQNSFGILLNKPVVALFPIALSFPTQLMGTTSNPKSFNLYNRGSGPLPITGVQITGSDSADFHASSHCGTKLAWDSQCSIAITFDPSAAGTRTATALVSDGALGKVQVVKLTGTGTVMTLLPASIGFGSELVGVQSAPQTATLDNHGNGTVSITSVGIIGVDKNDFLITSNTCGSSLGPGKTCSVTMVFKPLALGARAATLSIQDSGGGSPQTVKLSGSGT